MEFRYRAKDGSWRQLESYITNLLEDDAVNGIVVNSRDITDRKQAEQRVVAQLEEKEVLLKEVHHRVKNNLQIITSLLNLQAGEISDPATQSMFRDSMGRVKSMALIHERLYQSTNLAEVDFGDYVTNLTRFLMSTVSGSQGRITIATDIEGIVLPVDEAVPCGLIINEIVTNSLKHAFPGGEQGEIHISCSRAKGDQIILVVRDNGIGLAEDVDYTNTNSL